MRAEGENFGVQSRRGYRYDLRREIMFQDQKIDPLNTLNRQFKYIGTGTQMLTARNANTCCFLLPVKADLKLVDQFDERYVPDNWEVSSLPSSSIIDSTSEDILFPSSLVIKTTDKVRERVSLRNSETFRVDGQSQNQLSTNAKDAEDTSPPLQCQTFLNQPLYTPPLTLTHVTDAQTCFTHTRTTHRKICIQALYTQLKPGYRHLYSCLVTSLFASTDYGTSYSVLSTNYT